MAIFTKFWLALHKATWQGLTYEQLKGRMRRGGYAVFAFCLATAPAQAEAIRKACMASDRGAGRASLCRCIQDVADQTLTQRDRRLVVRFFTDPDRAQAIRHSSSQLHEEFWQRYERFGRSAEALCRR